jgi:hypothetical protein
VDKATSGCRRCGVLAVILAGLPCSQRRVGRQLACVSGADGLPEGAGLLPVHACSRGAELTRPQPNGALPVNGPADHLNGALMNSANKACQHLLPKSRPMTAAQQRQVTAQALRFTACMRSHGLPGMADPVGSASGISQRIPNGIKPNSPVFQSAQAACQKLMPEGPP